MHALWLGWVKALKQSSRLGEGIENTYSEGCRPIASISKHHAIMLYPVGITIWLKHLLLLQKGGARLVAWVRKTGLQKQNNFREKKFGNKQSEGCRLKVSISRHHTFKRSRRLEGYVGITNSERCLSTASIRKHHAMIFYFDSTILLKHFPLSQQAVHDLWWES